VGHDRGWRNRQSHRSARSCRQFHEARDALRRDLNPDGRPKRVNAERPKIFVEVSEMRRQSDRLDPGLRRALAQRLDPAREGRS
jgi:hypothetical protein